MNIVLLESLGISPDLLDQYAKTLEQQGHHFAAYERDTDPAVQIERAQDADILMIANMPLSGQVIRACKNLKFIDVAFTGVDHVDLQAAKEMGIVLAQENVYAHCSQDLSFLVEMRRYLGDEVEFVLDNKQALQIGRAHV